MAGATVLADAWADNTGEPEKAFGTYEARLRPWADAVQWMARRDIHFFTSANRLELLVRGAVLRLAARHGQRGPVPRGGVRDGRRPRWMMPRPLRRRPSPG